MLEFAKHAPKLHKTWSVVVDKYHSSTLESDVSEPGKSSVAAKLVNRLILSKIPHVLNTVLQNDQNGFWPERSTTAHIFALKRLMEGVEHKNIVYPWCTRILLVSYPRSYPRYNTKKHAPKPSW